MPSSQNRDDLLLEQFASTFNILDEMMADETLDPVAWNLATGATDDMGRRRWRPVRIQTDPAALAPVYAVLPAKFPPLYERLLLTYRWADVDLQTLTLMANPPGGDLSAFFQHVSEDDFLWNVLTKAGFLRFGKGPDVDYDPVCFDIRSRNKARDYAVVKIDHEEILCNSRIKILRKLADSFEDLVGQIIANVNAMTDPT
jgi:hypothetical protein